MSALGAVQPAVGRERFADLPPEQRALERDGVRLMVAGTRELVHTRFRELPEYLSPGDLVVVNTSATVAGQLDAVLEGVAGVPAGACVLHLGTRLDDGRWVVEVRTAPSADRAVLDLVPGTTLRVPRARIRLLTPFGGSAASPTGRGNRLWVAAVDDPAALQRTLDRRGRPIAYGYLARPLPLADYQTVFARHPGSAEMPSAGRPFTPATVLDLVTRGVAIAPVLLHTGVSSQEAGEPPQPERFEVPPATAVLVNAVRAAGGRVVAVGTSVTRALESAVDELGHLAPRRGWTDLVVGPEHRPQVVTGLLTGWHEPSASHLDLVEAVAGPALTRRAYAAARAEGYLWHEFGDSCLLLP